MERIKHYIDLLSKTKPKKDKVIEYLAGCEDIGNDYKNLIYFYLFPRNLMDMELPSRIMSYRGEKNKVGYLEPNVEETGLLLEAYRTLQYNRFIRHLLHTYTKVNSVFPQLGNDQCECGICRKRIWGYGEWDKICKQYPEVGEQDRKEYLAFAAEGTKINMCLPCLVQLQTLHSLLQIIEGDNYLDLMANNWSRKVKTRMPGPVGLDSDNDV